MLLVCYRDTTATSTMVGLVFSVFCLLDPAMPLCKPCVQDPESLNRSIDSGAFYVLCKLCLEPREPTFLGFPIMISLYKSLKR